MSKILRLPEVIQKTGLSKSSIYSFMANGEFVDKISIGSRAVGFLEEDIEQWISERIAASKKSA